MAIPKKKMLHFIIGSIMIQQEYRMISKNAQAILDINPGVKEVDMNKIGIRIGHTIPISIITNYLSELPESEITTDLITNIVDVIRGVSLITLEEDSVLKKAKLNSKLPEGVSFEMMLGKNPKISPDIR